VYSLRQIVAVTAMSVAGIPRRLGASLVIVIGIAGVVAVLISVFAMVTSFTATAGKTGRADRAIVLNRGSDSEGASSLPREAAVALLNAPGIKKDQAGKPILSAENLAFVRLTDPRTGLDTFVTLRGVGAQALALRPEIHLVEGRMFKPALHEMVVGRSLQRRLAGLEVGKRVALLQGDWTVVGAFESGGDSHESELLTDVETLLSAFQRNVFTSVTLMLDSPETFDAFKAALTTNPALSVEVKREPDYFSEASRPMASLLKIIASTIGVIMGLGAVFAAINTMYSAVSARSTEIATLRAIGYDGAPVVVSVLVEALLLALLGALIGATIAWVFFNGNSVSTVTGTSPSPVTYTLNVSYRLIGFGIFSACVIGLLGGLLPAARAARLSVAAAIRG
jgi:putative ABC transport system permease protein